MKILFLDCSMGVAGDMLAGALAEIAGIDKIDVKIPGVELSIEHLAKCGIASSRLIVKVHGEEEGEHHRDEQHHHHHHAHRNLAEVLGIIDSLELSDAVKNKAKSVYAMIADAESRAHGKPVAEVHFHEVGMMDAIADIVTSCWLMDSLNPEKVVVSPVNTGSGTVMCAHGEVAVPAPATAILLEGIPSRMDASVNGELCTPTGAALLKYFATEFGLQPLMTVTKTGCGAGKKDFAKANILRACLGESQEELGAGEIVELRFNVDDMTGEEIAKASNELFLSGAKDVSITPIFMKKGRPGHLFTVLTDEADKMKVVGKIFSSTSTIGMRETICKRYLLNRSIENVVTNEGLRLRRKISKGYGVEKSKIESDDL